MECSKKQNDKLGGFMTLTQLRSFLAIAREQNLTRAAESLNLSQSAISSQLKGLEEELGICLFERNARGMTLSESGQTLLSHAKEVLAACSSLQRCAESLSRGITASVTIGLNTDPTFLQVSAINKRLSLLHADLNVIFHASETTSTAQHLRKGSIDLGFYFGDLFDADIDEQFISNVRICVAIPGNLTDRTETLAWEDLMNLPWVWVDKEFPFYQALSDKIGPITRSPQQVVTAANEQIVLELVIAGQGIALMREDEARPLAAEGKVIIWEKGWCDIPLKLGWLKEKGSLNHIRKVREAISHIWTPATEQENYSEALTDKFWV